MTHPSIITSAILAQTGNHDPGEYYPAPLTCTECCARPRKKIDRGSMFWVSPTAWYVTTDDPLPDGWVTRTNEEYGFTSVLCPQCVEREKHGDE